MRMVEQALDSAQYELVLPHFIETQCLEDIVCVRRPKLRHDDVGCGAVQYGDNDGAGIKFQLANVLSQSRNVLSPRAEGRRKPYGDEEETDPPDLARRQTKSRRKDEQ